MNVNISSILSCDVEHSLARTQVDRPTLTVEVPTLTFCARLLAASPSHFKIFMVRWTLFHSIINLDWPSGRVSGWHFEPEPRSGRVAHIFNPTRRDSTGNWVNPTRPAKDPSLAPRGLNIENFPVFDFCITFLHYLLIESHEGEHEGRLIEGHDGETWRPFGRRPWRGNMKAVW